MRVILSVLLLAACTVPGQSVWLRPGTPTQTADIDLATCSREAQTALPERIRIATAPRVTIGASLCEGPLCIGVNDAPEIFDYDANAGHRARTVAACMGAKGYGLTQLPRCPRGPTVPVQNQPFDIRGFCVAQGRIAAPR